MVEDFKFLQQNKKQAIKHGQTGFPNEIKISNSF